MTNDNEVIKLADLIRQGTANESEQGLALKTVQTAMSVTMATGVNNIFNSMERLNVLLQQAINNFETKFAVAIQADTISMEDLMNFITEVQGKQLQLMDLYRKIVQGKGLFSSETLSEEEKKVVKLMKSFKSQKDKEEFLRICSEMLSKSDE